MSSENSVDEDQLVEESVFPAVLGTALVPQIHEQIKAIVVGTPAVLEQRRSFGKFQRYTMQVIQETPEVQSVVRPTARLMAVPKTVCLDEHDGLPDGSSRFSISVGFSVFLSV